MRKQLRVKLGFLLLLLLLSSGNVLATVSGQCSNCHTMHNSQNGVLDTTLSGEDVENVNRALTKGDCVGCHTGTIANSATDGIPYVMSTSGDEYGPDYTGGTLVNASGTNTLAGGTFNYVRDDDTQDGYAHNVSNIRAVKDSNMTSFAPPGWAATDFAPNSGTGGTITPLAVADDWTNTQLTCAGTSGCHGNHTAADDFTDIKGGHHGDDTTIDGSSVAKSYRFLRGILGYEDGDWELSVSSSDHNTYRGVDRNNGTTATGSMDKTTISYLCAECHGLFHSGDEIIYDSADDGVDNSNPWLRHPTDFALKSTDTNSEYLSYADADGELASAAGTTAVYNFVAPLASDSVGTAANNNVKVSTILPPTGAISNPFGGTDDNDIVTCLSCHRAHGSAYPDLLRWNYLDMQAGSGGDGTNAYANKGCFACHTTKD
jgi:hypothetical protein